MRMTTRVDCGSFWVEYDAGEQLVRVGDRALPRKAVACFPASGGQPQITLRLEVVHGVPQCRHVEIESAPGGREVRSADLRRLALDDLIEDTFGSVAMRIVSESGSGVALAWGGGAEHRRAAAKAVQRTRSASPRRVTPGLLADVARIYRENVEQRPTEAVQHALAVSYRSAGRYVQEARKAGLLPPTTPGKVTG